MFLLPSRRQLSWCAADLLFFVVLVGSRSLAGAPERPPRGALSERPTMFQSKREKEAQMQQTVSLLQVRRESRGRHEAPPTRCASRVVF